ncbi:MAG: TolC family protein, partial [Blastocatellia bacterium]
RLNYSATKLERVPSVVAFGDYGANGNGLNSSLPTRTYGFSVRVPVFDGGRRDARRAETMSIMQQQQLRTKDLEQQIQLDVRVALDALKSAAEEVKVAQDGLGLSNEELAQAQRRFEAGVTNSIEVVDAQSRLERARDNQVAALYSYGVARINLAGAMGIIRQMLR